MQNYPPTPSQPPWSQTPPTPSGPYPYPDQKILPSKKKPALPIWAITCGSLVMATVVLGTLFGCIAAFHGSSGAASTAPPAATPRQAQAPSAQPTHQPSRVPTVRPSASAPATIPAADAVLGGTIVAFDNKIGSQNCCQDNGWSDGDVQVDVYTAQDGARWYQAVGERSTERVTGIYLQLFGGSTWSIQQARKVLASYFPPDAHFLKALGNNEYEYQSTLLAHTLPASDFIDASGHLETPGLFFAYYDAPGNNPVDYCELATDRGFQNEVPLPPQ